MIDPTGAQSADGPPGGPPNVELWTRDGFYGDSAVVIRPHYTPEYLSVEGPHAPHRLRVSDLTLPDRDDSEALPLPFMTSRTGVQLSASARQAPMPSVVRNVEADEIWFVQEGELEFTTDFGTLAAAPGDFVCVPRAVAYRVRPRQTPTLSVVMEFPGAAKFDLPSPIGMIPPGAVQHAKIEAPTPPGEETTLLLKAFDGVTRYRKPHDPLAVIAQVGGTNPVWKLNLRKIQPLTYIPGGGAPGQFLSASNRDVLLYTLSARPGQRPPIHHNADYDELIYYFEGPGAWGAVDEPGTLTWVPKGATHHGPPEDVKEGYWAWLLETRATMRLTEAGLAAADLMETGMYGRHPAAKARGQPVLAGTS